MKTIALFNHKGGVSKTTTAFNLGWALTQQGKKVLVVDLDAQCNLTGLFLGVDSISDLQMEDFYNDRGNITMQSIVKSISEGRDPEDYMRSRAAEGKLHVMQGNSDLFLLPGHLDTAELDTQIGLSLKIAAGVAAQRNIPGNLPKLLQMLAESAHVDYVLYDLSPNVGGLNEVVLMSSDYFIVPTSPDFFCLQAIRSLSKKIKEWHEEIDGFTRKIPKSDAIDHPPFTITNKPCFLGAIHQRYRPRNGAPAKSFEDWIKKIGQEINQNLVPTLEQIDEECVICKDKLMDTLKDTPSLKPYDLAHIPDFNSLIAISQQVSKPVFVITNDDLTKRFVGKILGTFKENREKFRIIFSSMASRVITLTGENNQ